MINRILMELYDDYIENNNFAKLLEQFKPDFIKEVEKHKK